MKNGVAKRCRFGDFNLASNLIAGCLGGGVVSAGGNVQAGVVVGLAADSAVSEVDSECHVTGASGTTADAAGGVIIASGARG